MRMNGEQRIAAPRERVWTALNDPEVLRRCIPGCQSLERVSDDRLKATVAIRIGPIGASFDGLVTLADLDPPNGYTIAGEGQGGTAGFARGHAKVRLAEADGGTLLTYDVEAEVGGRLAQVGGVVIDATAKQLASRFFKTFGGIVTGEASAPPAGASGQAAAVAAAPVTSPSLAPADRSALMWFLSVFLSAFAGYLLSGLPDQRGALLVAVLVSALALVGFELGRRDRAR